MPKRSYWIAASATAGFMTVACFSAFVFAAEKKDIPDHSNFESCQACHSEKYAMWESSGHNKSISRVANANTTSVDCYGCHTAEGFAARREGRKVDPANKASFHSISCTACHSPRNTENPYRLVLDPEKLCESCHAQRAVLKGQGARGIEDTRSVHSGVACASCHMTEGNHRMEVLRPDDSSIAADRVDTCTACHKDGNRKARAKQLQEWQAWYKESMDPLQEDLKAVDAALKEKPEALSAELTGKLSGLKANLAIIQRDKSEGAHNLDFSLEIMNLARSDLKDIQAALGMTAKK